MIIRAFITHKVAETFSDCQDGFSVNRDTKSIAVSDGMSQSWQQKIWAQLLVEKFVNSTSWLPNQESIKPLCDEWRQKVISFIGKLKESNAPENLIYRNERNLANDSSAGATFVGIRFDGKNWNGSVLGDSCLIEWNGKEATFHTSQQIESFDNNPDYFDSSISKIGKGTPKEIKGILSKETTLFLVSDPFSDFLLERKKHGGIADCIKALQEIYSHEDFEALVNNWRKEGMHNDDTTIVVVEYNKSDSFNLQNVDNLETLIEKEKKEKAEPTPVETEAESPNRITRNDCEPTIDNGTKVNEIEHLKEDFLNEYEKQLKDRCSKMLSSNFVGEKVGDLLFGYTKEPALTAIENVFKKYSINPKQ